ncbi:MAG: hypothetical protein RBR97_13825 [Bacteroidales bacterium]|nr:hypothetical protein [Bacteroidales bacterium]
METKKIFTENEENWEYNSRISHGENIWLEQGEGYKLAIELLEKDVIENDRKNQDFLIYPYCFLIRHYIEIRLKEIIWECKRFKHEEYFPAKDNHDLNNLFRDAQIELKLFWIDSYINAPLEVKDFIKQMQNIDPTSAAFRFPVDKKNKNSLKSLTEINFKILSEDFETVKNYFESVTDGIASCSDLNDN